LDLKILPTTIPKGNEIMTTENDLAAQVAALEANVADMQKQLKHLFRLHGPATWAHVQKQRKENAKAQGTKLPVHHDQSHGQSNKPVAN
jgi:N-methylhydantoinase B/oxoprolinase/acetone carboxylase alpha subunit